MSYCGEPVRWWNLPDDWRDQCGEINDTLSSVGLYHNDILAKNVLVRDGIIYLVDFGGSGPTRATPRNDLIAVVEEIEKGVGMFSQRDEERVIVEHFGDRVGTFVDVGAYDGKTFSNTHALALRGWGGVCIEASPHSFVALEKLYFDRDDIQLVLATVSLGGSRLASFMDTADTVGSVSPEHVERWEDTVPYREIKTYCLPPWVLVEFLSDVDFLSIDLEGISESVAGVLVPSLMPELVCVEVDGSGSDFCNMMKHVFKYELVHQTDENVIHRRKE
jgi:hypothetical protein